MCILAFVGLLVGLRWSANTVENGVLEAQVGVKILVVCVIKHYHCNVFTSCIMSY